MEERGAQLSRTHQGAEADVALGVVGHHDDGAAAAGKGTHQGPGRHLPAGQPGQHLAEVGLEGALQPIDQCQGAGDEDRHGHIGLAQGGRDDLGGRDRRERQRQQDGQYEPANQGAAIPGPPFGAADVGAAQAGNGLMQGGGELGHGDFPWRGCSLELF